MTTNTPYVPAAGLHDMSLDALTATFETFCNFHSLPHKSADELLLEVSDTEHKEWLAAFLRAWEVEESAA